MPAKRFDESRLIDGVQFRVVDADRHTVTGLAAPYDRWTPIAGSYLERFTQDTFWESVTRGSGKKAPLLMHHDHRDVPVGKPVSWESTADGLVGVWQLDGDSERGREAHRLAAEGYMTALSVGFQPGDGDDIDTTGDVPRVTRGPARLLETSMVSVPAVDDARIIKVRSVGLAPRVDPRIAAIRRELGL